MLDVLSRVPAFRQLRADHYAENFADFARAAWKIVFPGRSLVWSPAYDLQSEVLTAIKNREPVYQRVVWNQPPRTGKSFGASIAWPCWVWLTQPEHSFVFASYSMDLSIEHSVARRNLIQSDWYQRLFGDRFQLSSDRNLATQFTNDHRGQMFATSTGARLTGFGFDSCVADDLTSPDMALSDSERNAANQWFDHTLRQRANDPASSAIIVIAQRTHELDVPGYLLESEPGTWTHIRIPLVAEEPQQYSFPISDRVWNRREGDVLMPKRFPAKVVAELQKRRLVWASQYQQAPVPLEGNMVKASDLRYYGGIDPTTGLADEALPSEFDFKLITVDCAFKNYSDSDYTAVLVIGTKGRKRFVLDCVNAHLDVAGMELTIKNLHQRWSPVAACLIEETASGVAVVQRVKVNSGVSGVIGVTPQGGKVARFAACSPEFQAHDWYFDRTAAWTEVLRTQLLAFPRARHDDLCDAPSQAATWLQAHPGYGEGVPFQIVPRDGPAATLRAALSAPPRPSYHDPRGFPEVRPLFGQPSPNIDPRVGQKILNGQPLNSWEEDHVIFGEALPLLYRAK